MAREPSSANASVSTTFIGWGGIAIAVAALVLRLHYIDVAQDENPVRADAGQYFRLAFNIVNHATFSTALPGATIVDPDSYRAPGYPLLIAVFLWLFGDFQRTYYSVLAAQCVLGASTVGLSILLAMRMMPRGYAYACGVLVGVWPHLITLGGYMLTETLFGFLLVLGAYFLARALDSRATREIAAAAVTFAAAALVNQIAAGLSAVLIAFLCLARMRRHALLFAILALGPPALWAVRDSQVHPPTRLSAAGRLMENVVIGMEPDWVPRYGDNGDNPSAVEARARIENELDTFATDPQRAFADIGKRLALSPGHYFVWYLTKPAQFWTWSIVQGSGDIYQYPMLVAPFNSEFPLRLIASICRGLNPIVMWAALGGVLLVLMPRRLGVPAPATCAGPIVVVVAIYATVLHSILTPDARYAAPFRPFEFMLALLSVCALATWWRRIRLHGSSAHRAKQ